jgi:formate dehydrogenase major subunit
MPYHWSGCGLVTGDAANELISFVADPNVSIMESKALTVGIEPGRRKRDYPPPDACESTGERDLPDAREARHASHKPKTEQMKEGHT